VGRQEKRPSPVRNATPNHPAIPRSSSRNSANLPIYHLPMPDFDPALAPVDRRLHPRYFVQVPIRLNPEGSDVTIFHETANLSLDGCNVLLVLQLPVGILVQAELFLGAHRVQVAGRVLTRHPYFGNGIMFLKFEDDGERVLRAYLEALDPR